MDSLSVKHLRMGKYEYHTAVLLQADSILRFPCISSGGRRTLGSIMHYFTPKRCTESNKIMYHDKAQALRAADQSWRERGAELWVYRCEYCGSWHLTHHDPSLRDMTPHMAMQQKPHSRKRGYKPRRR